MGRPLVLESAPLPPSVGMAPLGRQPQQVPSVASAAVSAAYPTPSNNAIDIENLLNDDDDYGDEEVLEEGQL